MKGVVTLPELALAEFDTFQWDCDFRPGFYCENCSVLVSQQSAHKLLK